MPRPPTRKTSANARNADTQANIGYEEKLWKAADTLRGTPGAEDDGEPFEQKMKRLTRTLEAQFAESSSLEKAIRASLKGKGYAP